ncbi:MAG TPA: 1,4-alpha-glucan branching protein GlgB [Gammaproteobacteria bacterium]|nr:1,4-alpha-glucan branching protein GlgB [Gammaproteobacteria bacterium]
MKMNRDKNMVPDDIQMLIEARHHDPFCVLGKHSVDDGEVVRVFIPNAREVLLGDDRITMTRLYNSDLFEWRGAAGIIPDRYSLTWTSGDGQTLSRLDPYSFPPCLSDYDLHLFREGKHWHAYRFLGAHHHTVDGAEGVLFSTWAPNAERISVVGDFNQWDGRCYPMRTRGASGVWELFIPGVESGCHYKYEIRDRHGVLHMKSDPYGQRFEMRPGTAAITPSNESYSWQDEAWMKARKENDWMHSPVSIYEVHLGSWQKNEQGHFLSYRDFAVQLVDYVAEMGFTHIELLPITEHPFDASWGYQTTGYYAATSRFGSPDDFRYFVDCCHQKGIGVILDWVPAHFPKDAHGLAKFDGSALYEHEDTRLGEHADWGTLIFNYGRNEVKNFLLSSALFWLEEMHLDGLRVDAVASMLYLDYSREEGEWLPNIHGGRENLEAVDFLRELNEVAHSQHPGAMIFAEESTAWPMVSRPTWLGGLGFSMKWNMGWMNDTLEFMSQDSVYRSYHHNMLTFSQLYAYTENFVLPFSHDEVVHMKKSLLYKMPGDEWQKFANLRLLYTYMFTHPGKKLLFMGCEFAQGEEWDDSKALDWYVMDYPKHKGVHSMVGDLNKIYKNIPALHRYDFDVQGFEWIDCHDSEQSVLSYMRRDGDDIVLVILNFTPVPREGYRIGVPFDCKYQEIFNSDSEYYGGSNMGNSSLVEAESQAWMNQPFSLSLILPPLSGVIFRPVR